MTDHVYYVYTKTEEFLWTVGYYIEVEGKQKWCAESDWSTEDGAIDKVAKLNGQKVVDVVNKEVRHLRARIRSESQANAAKENVNIKLHAIGKKMFLERRQLISRELQPDGWIDPDPCRGDCWWDGRCPFDPVCNS